MTTLNAYYVINVAHAQALLLTCSNRTTQTQHRQHQVSVLVLVSVSIALKNLMKLITVQVGLPKEVSNWIQSACLTHTHDYYHSPGRSHLII